MTSFTTQKIGLADNTSIDVPFHGSQSIVGIIVINGEWFAVADMDENWQTSDKERTLYALTPCCNASGTGVEPEDEYDSGVACRKCYESVDGVFGDVIPADKLIPRIT